MSHPAQAKYSACKAVHKNGRPCGMAIVRGGYCVYLQPEEQIARAFKKLAQLENEKQAILLEIERIKEVVQK